MKRIVHSTVKRGISLLLVLSALSTIPMSLSANENTSSNEAGHAIRVLKGLDTDQSKEWAVGVLKSVAEKDTAAYAMNAVGLAYMAGAGVEKDSLLALQWFERAGQHGYSSAYHNMGMMYKYAKCGIRQNFFKAFEAYAKGAELGSIPCKYDAGFMLYKGLGCRQNYEKAVELFREGAEKGHSPSLYMLGLCFRNGYGVEQDTAQASYYLNRSASLSYSPAMEELMRPYPENYLHEEFVSDASMYDKPESMPVIDSDADEISLPNGTYQGFLVMYDWSGKYILGEKTVSMTIRQGYDNSLAGDLVLADDTIPYRAKLTKDGVLSFSSGKVKLNERYTVGQKVNYKINKAQLGMWDNKICGKLSLYSLKEKEPERPMYIELQHADDCLAANGEDDRYSRISVSPSPFTYSFDATFELAEASNVQVRMFDKMGTMAYCQDLGHMDAGKHTVSVAPNIKDGYYVLNIKAGNQVLRTIIIKNGGEL